MIVFDLRCEDNHIFEAWFQNSDAFKAQLSDGHVECPYCGSLDITKSLMSPNIAAKGNRGQGRDMERNIAPDDHVVMASANVPDNMDASAEDVKRALQHMHETMKKYRNHVQKECDYVGDNFAEEARAIHDGTAETRGIYGEATLEETEELLSDGIDVLPVPGLDKLDS